MRETPLLFFLPLLFSRRKRKGRISPKDFLRRWRRKKSPFSSRPKSGEFRINFSFDLSGLVDNRDLICSLYIYIGLGCFAPTFVSIFLEGGGSDSLIMRKGKFPQATFYRGHFAPTCWCFVILPSLPVTPLEFVFLLSLVKNLQPLPLEPMEI